MDFTYKELALLNEMISVALLSGQIEFSEEAKTVHKKVADEIVNINSSLEEAEQI